LFISTCESRIKLFGKWQGKDQISMPS
jgi:hypothetical protein